MITNTENSLTIKCSTYLKQNCFKQIDSYVVMFGIITIIAYLEHKNIHNNFELNTTSTLNHKYGSKQHGIKLFKHVLPADMGTCVKTALQYLVLSLSVIRFI